MKSLAYKSFFGDSVSHEEELKKRISDSITDIIMEQEKVSEKSFSKVDDIIKRVNDFFTPEILAKSEKLYQSGKRINYISEILYDEYFHTNEGKVDTFSEFKKY